MLQKNEGIVGKGGEGGESSAQTDRKKYPPFGGEQVPFFRKGKYHPDQKTAGNVDDKGSQRPGGADQPAAINLDQKPENGADKSAGPGNKKIFNHGSDFRAKNAKNARRNFFLFSSRTWRTLRETLILLYKLYLSW